LYKGGPKTDPGNWRPITITNIIYRIIFCRIAQSIHKIHEKKNISLCDPDQKGVVPKRAGCVEHTAIANALINDAIQKKKPIYILSLDLRDAFGSIPHDLIKSNLTQLGFPNSILNLIMQSYEDAFISIQTSEGETEPIPIKKGVKQGCPLSPTLFNLGIDPLLRRINRDYKHLGYSYMINNEVNKKAVQAYADDLLLFSDTRNGLNHLIDITCDFMTFAHINFNPNKCRIIKYDPSPLVDAEFLLPNENNEMTPVKICEANEIVKYLGVPLSIRRLAKLKFNNDKVDKVIDMIDRVQESGLKINQILNAIRTFILPRLDYFMMNSTFTKGSLDKIDLHIRKTVNGLVGGPPLSKDLFYSSWKYGGLGVKNLRERYAACKINNISHFLLCDKDTRNFIF
jgi:hypothetical protein